MEYSIDARTHIIAELRAIQDRSPELIERTERIIDALTPVRSLHAQSGAISASLADGLPSDLEAPRSVRRSDISGAILLIGGLIALGIALAHIGSATTPQAVAWAFIVAAVIAALDRWA